MLHLPTPDVIEELDRECDRRLFEEWREQILELYTEGKPTPEGVFKRCLWRSGLVEKLGGRRHTWSDFGLDLILGELGRRGVSCEAHRSICKHYNLKVKEREKVEFFTS
ncbi:MAG: hypothetical protein ABSA11_10505 [Candidatus Bathyarchaeia archaeon]|jgi:hypothetical protein